ncbi:MAG: hypothetical protein ACO22M_00530 [Candidatus Nanopelagicaceae bacterium]
MKAQVKVVGKLFWAKHMSEPNRQFNETNNKYEICIGDLSDAIVQRLTNELGIKVKEKADDSYGRGKYVIAKSNYVIQAVDQHGSKVDPSAIGNGTLAECTISSYSHKLSALHGNGVSILHSAASPALKIKTLVSPPVVEEQEAEVSL